MPSRWPVAVKAVSMGLFFLEVILFGLAPQCLSLEARRLSLFMALGAGLFMSIALLHILPEANEDIHDYILQNYGIQQQFPYAFLIVVLVFTLVYSMHIVSGGHHSHHHIQEEGKQRELLLESGSPEQELENAKESNAALKTLQLGIAFHAFFEGLGLGVTAKTGPCIGLAIAISIHKWAEGLTLGLRFKNSSHSRFYWTASILAQALLNPLGVGIGMLISNLNGLLDGVFTSVSAGTFLYVAIVEMLEEAFGHDEKTCNKAIKIIFMHIGVLLVSCMWFLQNGLA